MRAHIPFRDFRLAAMFSLLLICLFAASPSRIQAYCPVPEIKVNGEFFQAQSVFIGAVTSIRAVPDKGEEVGGWFYRIHVKGIFRGSVPRETSVFTEDASNRFPLDLNHQYLLFTYKWHGRLLIDSCDNSALLSDAQNSLQILRNLRDGKLPSTIEGSLYEETEGIDLSGVVVTIRSRSKTYRVTTDKSGWFRFAAPPGIYEVDFHSGEYYENSGDVFWYNPRRFHLHAGECASLQLVSVRH
jgi:hypothetical protein